jgi:hypothetical protein
MFEIQGVGVTPFVAHKGIGTCRSQGEQFLGVAGIIVLPFSQRQFQRKGVGDRVDLRTKAAVRTHLRSPNSFAPAVAAQAGGAAREVAKAWSPKEEWHASAQPIRTC